MFCKLKHFELFLGSVNTIVLERCSICNLCVYITSSRQDSQHQTEEVKTKHNGKPEDRLVCLLKDTKAKTLRVECVYAYIRRGIGKAQDAFLRLFNNRK